VAGEVHVREVDEEEVEADTGFDDRLVRDLGVAAADDQERVDRPRRGERPELLFADDGDGAFPAAFAIAKIVGAVIVPLSGL